MSKKISEALKRISKIDAMREQIPTMKPDWGKVSFTALPQVAAASGALVIPDNGVNRRELGRALAYLETHTFKREERQDIPYLMLTSDLFGTGIALWNGANGFEVSRMELVYSTPDPFNPAPAQEQGWELREIIRYDKELANKVEFHNNRVKEAHALIGTEQEEEWMKFMSSVRQEDARSAYIIAVYAAAGIPIIYALNGAYTGEKEQARMDAITNGYRRALWAMHGFKSDEYPTEEAAE